MSKTLIEYVDRTWNPISGCTPISEGCANCYAARMAKRLAGRYGYPKDEPFRPGTIHDNRLNEPYLWKSPQRVFVCSMGDLFHPDVSVTYLEEVLARITHVPQHTFMILTKRADRLKLLTPDRLRISRTDKWPLPNLWLGVTAENQRTADERIPILLQIPAAKHFVSVEPMLEPVNLNAIRIGTQYPNGGDNPEPYCIDAFKTHLVFGDEGDYEFEKLDWVIAGPETGPRARPTSVDWVRDLQRQCSAAGVPFFDKKDLLGETIQEWPR